MKTDMNRRPSPLGLVTAVCLLTAAALSCKAPEDTGGQQNPPVGGGNQNGGGTNTGGGSGDDFPSGCRANAYSPPGGDHCTAECVDCECTSIKYTCDSECYEGGSLSGSCLISSSPDGTATPGAGYENDCQSLSCSPEDDLTTELSCTASQCEPPPAVNQPTCPSGQQPPAGSFGTKYECYAFTTDTGQVWAIDREAKSVQQICTTPSSVGVVEAFAISPITGNSFVVAQDTGNFGKFIPKEGNATCLWTPMGVFPSKSIGGMAFSPDGVLYVGDEVSGDLWKFANDPVTKDPIAQWTKLPRLPNGSEAMAINPLDGRIYNVDEGGTLHIVSQSSPGQSLFSCRLPGSGWDTSLSFDHFGGLHATNTATNEFVSITVNESARTCTVTARFSTNPAHSLEGGDCNNGCAYDTCVCQ